MSNSNQDVNVTVSTPDELHDAKVRAWREQERKVIEGLRERIFFVKSQGNQRYYYDVKTGANSLTVQHLIGIVIHEMKRRHKDWDVGLMWFLLNTHLSLRLGLRTKALLPSLNTYS